MKKEELVKILRDRNLTISTMESCTGGSLAGEITNVSGASEVFCLGLVTYSTDMKIKMGVPKTIIDEYTVYSIETANEMSKGICNISGSDIGVGTTGVIGRKDPNNKEAKVNLVYVSIYFKNINEFKNITMEVKSDLRVNCKEEIIQKIVEKLISTI